MSITKSNASHMIYADAMDPFPGWDLPLPSTGGLNLDTVVEDPKTKEFMDSLPSDSARKKWLKWRKEHRDLNRNLKNALPIEIGRLCICQDDDGSLFVILFKKHRLNLRKQVGYWTSHEKQYYDPMFSKKTKIKTTTKRKTKSTPVTTMEGLGNEAIF